MWGSPGVCVGPLCVEVPRVGVLRVWGSPVWRSPVWGSQALAAKAAPHLDDFLRDVGDGEAVEAHALRKDAGQDPTVQLEGDLAHQPLPGQLLGLCRGRSRGGRGRVSRRGAWSAAGAGRPCPPPRH